MRDQTTSKIYPNAHSYRFEGSCDYYLKVMLGAFIAAGLAIVIWAYTGKDHFAAIPRGDDANWYRNYSDATSRAIQDRDIFYHNIGHSIDNARTADIILLGHSMVLWGMRDDQIQEFGRRHGIKIFNMASAGDGSGEFLRLVIKRWHLKPKLWIINADDHAANFFNTSLDDFGNSGVSSAPLVVKYSRFHGFLNVVGRDLRWRLEDLIVSFLPEVIARNLLVAYPGLHVYRSAADGNWDLQYYGSYMSPNDPYTTLVRDQNCPSNQDEIARAKKYISDIGGDVLLTLFPYSESCPQRVKDIATALNLETIIPPDVHYTTIDEAHLDKKGATAFTTYFLSELESTKVFKRLAPH